MELNREEVKVAIDSIGRMATWADTPQGHDYWRSVRMELIRLLRDTESPEPQPQYRDPNEGDVGKWIEVALVPVEGKEPDWWKVIYQGKFDEWWLGRGEDKKSRLHGWNLARVAIEPQQPPQPEWITPTDEDAKRRPEVEVRDHDGRGWIPTKLICVSTCGDYPFFTLHGSSAIAWRHCRMRKDAQ